MRDYNAAFPLAGDGVRAALDLCSRKIGVVAKAGAVVPAARGRRAPLWALP